MPSEAISSSTVTSPVDLNRLDKVAKNKTTIDKDGFLKLFVAQLQNQDPTNGMDSGESMQQMTSFSMVEQMTNMATDMKTSNTRRQPDRPHGHLHRRRQGRPDRQGRKRRPPGTARRP